MNLIRIDARDLLADDELIVGPQGPVPEAPTVMRVEVRDDGVIVAELRDNVDAHDSLFSPDNRLTVLRREEQ